MEINGKEIQEKLLPTLRNRITILKNKGVTPGIAIVTLGEEESWEAYVKQKIKLSRSLGINHKLINLKPKTTDEVLKAIDSLNNDNTIHGLIVQRPFPIYIDTERIIQSISKYKDIDGFRNDSLYKVPVWLACKNILTHASILLNSHDFSFWLSQQTILVIGKGETAGGPVIKELQNLKVRTLIIDSKTHNLNELFKSADVIIFATGKSIDAPWKLIKKECVLIGIGLHRVEGLLVGDFDEFEAKKHVLYYTPSPGGIGPLNLYYLYDNLITAAETLTP